jgi:hypothetical protein
VRFGAPITGEGRPDRAAVAAMTARLADSLAALVADAPEPRRTGRVARWVTERFNDWPEGSREAALEAQLAGNTADPLATVIGTDAEGGKAPPLQTAELDAGAVAGG